MYIEMTTFAIPTFLISIIKFSVIAFLVWFVICCIGMYFYGRSMDKHFREIKENK